MTDRYDAPEIEKKWQERWEADNLYRTPDDDPRPKWYALTMFPYTSGDLHVGHWYAMAPSDVQARYKRMRGYNVRGITTAATIWSAAAVGMAVGQKLYLVAVLGALLVFVLLESRPVVRAIDDYLRRRVPLLIAHEPEEKKSTKRDDHDR